MCDHFHVGHLLLDGQKKNLHQGLTLKEQLAAPLVMVLLPLEVACIILSYRQEKPLSIHSVDIITRHQMPLLMHVTGVQDLTVSR